MGRANVSHKVFGHLRGATIAAVLGISSFAIASGPALAQAGAYGQNVTLSPEIVGNFVASYPEVEALADQLDDQYDVPENGGDSPADAMAGYLAYQGAMAQFDQLVQQYGFAGFTEWLPVMSAVVSAWTFAEQGGNMDAQMAEAIAQIQNNPGLSDAQKEMLLEQLGAAAANLGAAAPPQENIDAVEPYAAEIGAMFEG